MALATVDFTHETPCRLYPQQVRQEPETQRQRISGLAVLANPAVGGNELAVDAVRIFFARAA